jgi:hypothetical protein
MVIDDGRRTQQYNFVEQGVGISILEVYVRETRQFHGTEGGYFHYKTTLHVSFLKHIFVKLVSLWSSNFIDDKHLNGHRRR